MKVSLKTEQRRRHTTVSSFRPWVRRAEGYRGTRHVIPSWQVPVKPSRPPSLPLICRVFPADSSFSVFRETSMARAIHFKELNCYVPLCFAIGFAEEKLEPRSRKGSRELRSSL